MTYPKIPERPFVDGINIEQIRKGKYTKTRTGQAELFTFRYAGGNHAVIYETSSLPDVCLDAYCCRALIYVAWHSEAIGVPGISSYRPFICHIHCRSDRTRRRAARRSRTVRWLGGFLLQWSNGRRLLDGPWDPGLVSDCQRW